MKTSYEGCHPEIAESLKRGEHFKCVGVNTSKGVKHKGLVVTYLALEPYGKYLMDNIQLYHGVELIKTETYVIDAVSMMKGLIERGYTYQLHGRWENKEGHVFEDWIIQGEKLSAKAVEKYNLKPWMLVQKEIE